MAGFLVVHSGRYRSPRPRYLNLVVLLALAVGLLAGGLACAAGLGLGQGHMIHAQAASEVTASIDAGGAHSAAMSHAESSPTVENGVMPEGDHRDGASGGTTAQSHPGMACVVSVDLRFLQPSLASVAEFCGSAAGDMVTEWSADVEPPIPRIS